MEINFRTFFRVKPDEFGWHCVILTEDEGIPYDIRFGCKKDFIPKSFSVTSKRNEAILKIDNAGVPTHMRLISRDEAERFKFKAEFKLDSEGYPEEMRFYLPPNGDPVKSVDELTDIRQATNNINDSDFATGEEIAEAVKDKPLLDEVLKSSEFHLEFIIGLLNQSLLRARAYK